LLCAFPAQEIINCESDAEARLRKQDAIANKAIAKAIAQAIANKAIAKAIAQVIGDFDGDCTGDCK
jgi:ribosomal protein L18